VFFNVTDDDPPTGVGGDELECGFDLRSHRTRGKFTFGQPTLNLRCRCLLVQSLRRSSVSSVYALLAGEDQENFSRQFAAQQSGGEVLVEDAVGDFPAAAVIQKYRNTATAKGHWHLAILNHCLNVFKVEDLLWSRGGDEPALTLSISAEAVLRVAAQELIYLMIRQLWAYGLLRFRKPRVKRRHCYPAEDRFHGRETLEIILEYQFLIGPGDGRANLNGGNKRNHAEGSAGDHLVIDQSSLGSVAVGDNCLKTVDERDQIIESPLGVDELGSK